MWSRLKSGCSDLFYMFMTIMFVILALMFPNRVDQALEIENIKHDKFMSPTEEDLRRAKIFPFDDPS